MNIEKQTEKHHMTAVETLLEIAKNKKAMALLDDSLKTEIAIFRARHENEVEAEKQRRIRIEKQQLKEKTERQAKHMAEINKILCRGTWEEKVPLRRRFVLCSRVGKKFVGYLGQEDDPSKWADEDQYCAIDLVRGYMGPYFGYYGASFEYGKYFGFYKNALKPIFDAEFSSDEELYRKIRAEFDFFKFRPEELNVPIRILDYVVKADGNIELTGESEAKTLAEHQADLKKEFDC